MFSAMSRRILASALLAAVVCALVVAPAATAKSPPPGKYECTLSGVGSFGKLKIVDKKSYVRNGKKGKYKAGDKKIDFPDGFTGWKLKFTSGSFDGYKGRWYTADSGVHEIALENPADDEGFESIYCDD
jgi:hypothetical protein